MLTNRSGIQEWFVRPKLHVPRRHRELHSEKHLVKKMAMNPASWNAYSVSNQGVWSLKLFAWRVVICFHSSWGICAFGAILLQPEPLVSNRHVIQTLRLRKNISWSYAQGSKLDSLPIPVLNPPVPWLPARSQCQNAPWLHRRRWHELAQKILGPLPFQCYHQRHAWKYSIFLCVVAFGPGCLNIRWFHILWGTLLKAHPKFRCRWMARCSKLRQGDWCHVHLLLFQLDKTLQMSDGL